MSATCLTSGSQHNLNVPVISSDTKQGAGGEKAKFLTPTLRRSPTGRLPHSSGKIQSLNRNSLQVPSPFAHQQHRNSPSSPRSVNIQDRLIPCRSQTDMQLAQHLLSPLSHRAGDHYDSEQQDSSRQVTRILNFGTKVVKAKPFSLVTASLACGTTPKPKFKIPTKPDRVMAAPGTFLDCGSQSAHWAPSASLVVALETGVYVCQINEDSNVTEICNNNQTPENPFCQVIWDSAGESVVCGKAGGEIHIRDLRTSLRQIKWQMLSNHAIRSIALEQDQLLTCGTTSHGVRIYDLRQTGGSSEPILALKSRTSVNSLSWSSNGHLLAGGCESGQIYLWDVRSPSNEIKIFKTQDKNPIQVVNWCSWKSSVLFSGSSFPKPSICLHNTATGVLIGDYECASEVSGIQFNADLKQVATSHHSCLPEAAAAAAAATHIHGAESTVQLWQLTSNRLNPILKLDQHEDGIVSMAASVNGNQLLTMGGDELLCLWHWNETASHSNANKAGFQTARSQLNACNLIR
ncbi:protein FIZZY-RELATED 3-like [Daphnia pulicaria]|uniref:protein FIZZY-RELATED 3-like n=1 Tax=Daphnia pulicaria TaxID=35523 RepID=UPI001EEA0A01|nr:protein FIZZY-RELATED 3-like [Daphnia pulicaria]